MKVRPVEANVSIASHHSCLLGEGPVWNAALSQLIWVDIVKGEIHELSVKTGSMRTIPVNQMIGSLAICKNGNYIAALKKGLAFVDRENGEVKMIEDPLNLNEEIRFNDGKCDPAGRFWAGTMSMTDTKEIGEVYMFDKDLHPKLKISKTTISNGMAWSRENDRFYFIDTPTMTVTAYDYNNSNGDISNPKIVIRVAMEDGSPDGMTIDNEGMLWIAHWDGWQVTRWNPFTGEKLLQIPMPVARPTCCTFGGDDLTDLYISSSKEGLSDDELNQQPDAGKLFVVRNSGYMGMPTVEFGQ